MLKTPVFLDSSALNDLREILTEGVDKSDCLVLLATKGVLMRPWCLLEILQASRKNIPVVFVLLGNGGFSMEDARAFATSIEATMKDANPTGLALL
eukprot:5875802-Prymnesium_polylepis.1